MPTKLGICNSALHKVGAARITSLSDGTKAALILNDQWQISVDKLLRMHKWNFAIKRVSLAVSSTAPEFGYTYAYPLPSGCLRVLPADNEGDDDDFEYVIEGGNLLTDETTAKIRYIYRVTDESLFDPLFAEALSSLLAADIAFAITQNASLTASKLEEFNKYFKLSIGVDAREGKPPTPKCDVWIASRRG